MRSFFLGIRGLARTRRQMLVPWPSISLRPDSCVRFYEHLHFCCAVAKRCTDTPLMMALTSPRSRRTTRTYSRELKRKTDMPAELRMNPSPSHFHWNEVDRNPAGNLDRKMHFRHALISSSIAHGPPVMRLSFVLSNATLMIILLVDFSLYHPCIASCSVNRPRTDRAVKEKDTKIKIACPDAKRWYSCQSCHPYFLNQGSEKNLKIAAL